jgi:glycogen operon protein
MTPEFRVSKGGPAPLGPTILEGGVNFALFSAHATAVTLCLFSKTGKREIAQIRLTEKTGDIWHGFVKGLEAGQLYGYRVDGPYAPQDGHRFNVNKLLIDPYAKQLFGEFILNDALYGFDINAPEKDLSFDTKDSAPFMPKCVVGDVEFDWDGDVHPRTDLSETIIYECHVKGATMLKSDVPKRKRGTMEGLSSPAMLKHLKALGVSAVEILPLQSFFSELRLLEMGLTNYWGYNPVNYFAPHNAYLGPAKSQSIQTMVKAFHAANIEVILDVVYNHTAESWELGPTLSYRGIDNKSYYHLTNDKRFYENYTGCGNSLNMTHPAVLELTIASLRHWVETYHIDGFRFDLGPTMGRNPNDFDREAAFFKALKNDPVLSQVKFIAEPWDIGPGGYQLGGFPSGWSEWNDQYRDSVRSFWRGDSGAHKNLAGRLLGSAENFDHDGRSALASVNFIAAHDGFTLQDTVSFNEKRNHANGENNRDGHGHNLSDNMGTEGATDNLDIIENRRRRKINMLATLLLSQGVPMLLAGDEFGQSQKGNNNAYCQDNEITWLDWSEGDDHLQAAVTELVKLRKKFPHFGQSEFLHGETVGERYSKNVDWLDRFGNRLTPSGWDDADREAFGMMLTMKDHGSVLIVINRSKSSEFILPIGEGWTIEFASAKAILDDQKCYVPDDTVVVLSSPSLALPRDVANAAIEDEAERAGIISEFWDISGHHHVASTETKSAILEAMASSFHKSLPSKPKEIAKAVYGAKALKERGRVWGITAALYGLKSARNWGIGDFEDLANLAEEMGSEGADFIGINPAHALFPTSTNLYAPYSPSSRDFLNIMHIAPDKIPEFSSGNLKPFQLKIRKARETEFVDYKAVYALKFKAFETAYAHFITLSNSHPRRIMFEAFKKREGGALCLHAVFDAIYETLPKNKRTYDGYKNFPKKLQSPDSAAVQKFAQDNRERVEFYCYLQWIAQNQLQSAQNRAVTAGMSIGLYLDYAVGVVPGGSDVWRNRGVYAEGISLGAPGDAANPDGQVWNLVPYNPHKLAANNFEPYRSSLRRMMQQAGAVRIDHILGHMRSFWIPNGEGEHHLGGAYVRYPLEGLLNMIAEESQAAECVVIGEDLGTIPDGLRNAMQTYDLMGCSIAIIERSSDGHLVELSRARELSLTSFSNHDFPTLAGFWKGTDFDWRADLGIASDELAIKMERERRERDKHFLQHQAGYDGSTNGALTTDLAADLQSALARSPALAVAVQLEDLLLQTAQPNVPGTTEEQPNWRRKYSADIKSIASYPSAKQIISAMRMARSRKEG